ncbi:sucrose phosphorylase [Glaciecola sp. 1036]|uniref:sucrose phosphorylase n=1 Tax=Alteromonadaceae TaxID=72275 RepID=UPI003CFBF966
MSDNNKVQLITYVDRFGGKTLSELHNVLTEELKGIFAGVHLLPFYYPIDGADAGFDPIDHTTVDNRLGSWSDIAAIGSEFDIMADMIVNHISADSDAFKDVLKHCEKSKFWELFLRKDSVFKQEQEEDIKKVFRPRPTSFFSDYTLADGKKVPFWTTFTAKQIDIDVTSKQGKNYLDSILTAFAKNNIKLIRLDAAGYAIKKAGSSCFMLNETFEFIQALSERAQCLGLQCLVEVHSHYQTQIDIAKKCSAVYDFALPPLILHSLFSKNVDALSHWLKISPRNCFTVLDTHDGIGIVDVGPSSGKPGLLGEKEIDLLVETIHRNSANQSRKATGASASNVDLYQVNCTFYDALARDDKAYLLARAIQLFCPGIPQIYYAGFLACENDMGLLEKTNVGRDINRPYISKDVLLESLKKPVVKALISLIDTRNNCSAFSGEFSVKGQGSNLSLEWKLDTEIARLDLDVETLDATIVINQEKENKKINLASLLNEEQNKV